MARLSLDLLGSFQVLLDGRPVATIETAKGRALLAYLAIEADRPHRRDALAGLLWPDMPDAAARRNLSQALFNLRQAIGDHTATPPFLLITRDSLQFNDASDHAVDVVTFTRWLDVGSIPSLQQAVELYRGSFLHQFFLKDSAAFEEWALVRREDLHRRALDALYRLAGHFEQQADYTSALRYAGRQLELDSWREEAHRQLMRAYALSGQRSAALAQYETCKKVLAGELGVEPTTETKTLYEQIKDGELKQLRPVGYARSFNSLPSQLTLFIGRERELSELAQLLADPACRLLTVIGPGGIGKTRLAIGAAARQRAAFPDGMAFVALQSVMAIESIVPAVAEAVGFTFSGSADPKTQLLNFLGEKQALLLLDNFEHMLDGVPLLLELLERASAIKLLVTSREPLNVQSEWVFPLAGLGEDSAALFAQSARRARANFEWRDEDRAVVERICQWVDGAPLGIELAASWVRTLSLTEIAQQIERDIGFLATTARDVPERHRSITAVFDHSWRLLDAREQNVLKGLSVFRGGFTREAARAAVEASLGMLSTLVTKSLLRRTSTGRYDMHELVRQYAAARLSEDPREYEETHDHHSRYFLIWLQAMEMALKSPQQSAAVAEITAEIDNIRAAWDWATARPYAPELARVCRTLFWFFEIRFWVFEDIRMLQRAIQALNLSGEAAHHRETSAREKHEWLAALGAVLTMHGFLCWRSGRFGEARAPFERSLAILRSLDAPLELADVQVYFGSFLYLTGGFVQGEALVRDALQYYQTEGRDWDCSHCFFHLGNMAGLQGRFEEAYDHLSVALRLIRRVGDPAATVRVLNFLAAATHAKGADDETQALAREALDLAQSIGDRWSAGEALHNLGLVARSRRDYSSACELLHESSAIFQSLADAWGIGRVLNNLARAELEMGDPATAQSDFQRALTMALTVQMIPTALDSVIGLAEVATATGTPDWAFSLLSLASNHPAIIPATKRAAERLRAALESQLTPEQIKAAQAVAQTKSLESLAREILAVTPLRLTRPLEPN